MNRIEAMEAKVRELEAKIERELGFRRDNRPVCRVCGGPTRQSEYATICKQELGPCGLIAVLHRERKRGRSTTYSEANFSRTRWRHGGLDDPYVEGLESHSYPNAYVVPGHDGMIPMSNSLSIEQKWAIITRYASGEMEFV